MGDPGCLRPGRRCVGKARVGAREAVIHVRFLRHIFNEVLVPFLYNHKLHLVDLFDHGDAVHQLLEEVPIVQLFRGIAAVDLTPEIVQQLRVLHFASVLHTEGVLPPSGHIGRSASLCLCDVRAGLAQDS
ncbi:hypothetical protein INR49_024319 [Caranx melampygus]|nr:hypothetical protein INR49_024319 [Caranx melampygus]